MTNVAQSKQPEAVGMIYRLPLSDLHECPMNPFAVREDPAMLELMDSVQKFGVLVPAIARPRPEGGYEIIAGHRRKRASELSYEDRETLQREQMVALEKVRMIEMLLTEKQFRRLWLYAVEKKTLAQIAEQEGATISSVQESIDRAKKRCRKFFKTP